MAILDLPIEQRIKKIENKDMTTHLEYVISFKSDIKQTTKTG